MALSFQVTFDAADPAALSVFWADVLHYIVQPPPPGFETWEDLAREVGLPEEQWDDIAAIVDPDEKGPRLLFLRVPEPKTAKNRVHLDVNATTPGSSPEERRRAVDAEVERIVALRASKIADFDEPAGVWTVMKDPEGNEFCVH
ncbi:MAG: VOC family protein [Proteobacteria bacterium]|nr:VOC family protein [Pseudomonadota bacterium]